MNLVSFHLGYAQNPVMIGSWQLHFSGGMEGDVGGSGFIVMVHFTSTFAVSVTIINTEKKVSLKD